MKVEKLNQGELNWIEKYVESIVNKKIMDLQTDEEEREQAIKKIKQNTVLNKLLSNYVSAKKKIDAIQKRLDMAENAYSIRRESDDEDNYYFKLAYDWASKNKKQQEAKIKKVRDAHKEFTEALIFKSMPEILKAIMAIERI